jgi:hypothetical protein
MRGVAVASIALVMLLFLIELFVVHSGFGLFKLVMYLQPFMIGSLVLGIGSLLERRQAIMSGSARAV